MHTELNLDTNQTWDSWTNEKFPAKAECQSSPLYKDTISEVLHICHWVSSKADGIGYWTDIYLVCFYPLSQKENGSCIIEPSSYFSETE